MQLMYRSVPPSLHALPSDAPPSSRAAAQRVFAFVVVVCAVRARSVKCLQLFFLRARAHTLKRFPLNLPDRVEKWSAKLLFQRVDKFSGTIARRQVVTLLEKVERRFDTRVDQSLHGLMFVLD